MRIPTFKTVFILASLSMTAACQHDRGESGSTTAPSAAASVAADAPDASSPAKQPEPFAVTAFRRFCVDTQGDPARIAGLVASEGLHASTDNKAYSRPPQRGTRDVYRLSAPAGDTATFDLAVSSAGGCAIRMHGPGAQNVEAAFVSAFDALRVPAPQPPNGRAGVFIPFGKAITAADVGQHGLVNTMTASTSDDSAIVYIPPPQALEVIREAQRR